MVEGIDVAVEIDWDCDEQTVRSSANRRELFGYVFQTVPEYPYMRAMGGSRTFEEWRTIRFNRHYAGLAVYGPTDEATETLAALRHRQKSEATAAPRPDTHRCALCGGPVVRIAYGFPGPEMWDAAERGEIVLGGCLPPVIGDATHSCSCGTLTATITDNER